jgi:hypothetical protein
LDALSFVLFGKPYRSIKLGDLVNRFNGKDLEVQVEFEIDKDVYTISRGYKPAKFAITKNGQELNILSAKKLNQEEIDKLLGINYILFKNIVAVASTYNKPFLMLSAGERRTLVETIFNIYVLALMLKEVKSRTTINKTQQKLNVSNLTGLNEQKTSAEKFVNDTAKILQQFEINKQNTLNKINSDISNIQSTIERCNKNISLADKKLVELQNKIDPSEAVNELAEINAKKNFAAGRIIELDDNIAAMRVNTKCPICNSDLTGEHAAAHIKEMQEELYEQNAIFLDNTRKLELEKLIADFKKNKSLYDTIILKKAEQVSLLNTSKTDLKNYEDEKAKTEASVCDIDVQQYKDQLDSINARITNLSTEIDNLDKKMKMDSMLSDILSDDGIKTYFFEQLLPQLNSQVNKYINAFGLQVTLEFDKSLEAKIQQGKYECEYMGFSNGERARIDMAILLSFFDISRNISNWSCNVLFIDEVMDNGVDSDGIESFISTLYNVVTGNSNKHDIGIYLISHKLTNTDVAWDSVVDIVKTNRFSELKVKNNNESSTN